MKRIGITQRVVYVERVQERRDVLDQRWYDVAKSLGVLLIPIPNKLDSPTDYVTELNIRGLIFSGGNNIGTMGKERIEGETLIDEDVAYERDKTETELLSWASENKIPVVGVCRGMQLINAYFRGGQENVDASIHVARNHSVECISELYQNIYGSKTEVNSYHRYGIMKTDMAKELKVDGVYNLNEIEAFSHKKLPLYGIMWHPERYNEIRSEDVKLFSNIFSL